MAAAAATQEPSWRFTLPAMLRSLWAQQSCTATPPKTTGSAARRPVEPSLTIRRKFFPSKPRRNRSCKNSTQEKIEIVVAELAAMELRDRGVEFAGDVRDGLCGIGFPEHRFEDLTDLARGDAAKKSLADQFVHGFLPALVARQDL